MSVRKDDYAHDTMVTKVEELLESLLMPDKSGSPSVERIRTGPKGFHKPDHCTLRNATVSAGQLSIDAGV